MQALKLFVIILCLYSEIKGSTSRKSVSVIIGEGFLIFGSTEDSSPQSCELTRLEEVYSFAPGEKKRHTLINGEVLQILQISNCGLRVFNTSIYSDGEWLLSSLDETGTALGVASIKVSVWKEMDSCPHNSNCRMTNLDSPMEETCADTDWANYKCEFWGAGKMTKSSLELHNHQRKTDFKSPMVIESGSKILECNWDYEAMINQPLSECYIEHLPTGRKYYIDNNLQDTRYSSFMTDIQGSLCQFEIPKDILDEEVGVWKMTLSGSKSWSHPGRSCICKFRLEGNSTKQREILVERTKEIIDIKTNNDPQIIKCANNIYYPIQVCYLMHSDGELLYSKDYAKLEEGTCEFDVSPGNWTCGFNGPTIDDEDFSQSFEVIHYDKEIIDESFGIAEGGRIVLECHLTLKKPLKMCIFISPSGRVYRLPSDNFKSKSHSYYSGGKWATGDCGIEFEENVHFERGNWKCKIEKMNGEMLSSTILVE